MKEREEVLCYIHADYIDWRDAVCVGIDHEGNKLWMCDTCAREEQKKYESSMGAYPGDSQFSYPRRLREQEGGHEHPGRASESKQSV